jgi:predicted transcriptional regulator
MDPLEEIRKRRLTLGIGLGELARAVGRSEATISRIERGRIRPSYELVRKMLTYLDEREGEAAPHLTARDLLNPTIVTVEAETPLLEAARLMERGGYSQLPVVEEGRVTGALSESTLLRALATPAGRRGRVRDVQEAAYPTVDATCTADLLAILLTRYAAVIVTVRGQLKGIVTKTDLIRGLRGTPLRRPNTTSQRS